MVRFFLFPPQSLRWQLRTKGNGEGLILNLHWICFCDFNPFLLYTMACLREITWAAHLWRKGSETNTFPCLRVAICKDWIVFVSSPPPHLWSIKDPGNQAQTRWLFWGTSLPSFQSAGSQIKSSSLPLGEHPPDAPCLPVHMLRAVRMHSGSKGAWAESHLSQQAREKPPDEPFGIPFCQHSARFGRIQRGYVCVSILPQEVWSRRSHNKDVRIPSTAHRGCFSPEVSQ